MDSDSSVPSLLVSNSALSSSQVASVAERSSTVTDATTRGTTSDLIRFEQMLMEAMKDPSV